VDQEVKIGNAIFRYWLGPGGVFPWGVKGYVQRGGATKYSLDSEGVLWRWATLVPCGTEFTALGELFPNDGGSPRVLWGGSFGELFASNVVLGAGAPDCFTPADDAAIILSLLDDAIKTTFNQALFSYLNEVKNSSIAEAEIILGNTYIEDFASIIRGDIIEKFRSYRYIVDAQAQGFLGVQRRKVIGIQDGKVVEVPDFRLWLRGNCIAGCQ